ncbi:MAG: SPOR domain-containing protein [Muribaculaceae bacterium]|nr:SPOR domain-containing protein [Muribaculaceae bacterium]
MKHFRILSIVVVGLLLALATNAGAQVNNNAPNGLLDRPTTSKPSQPDKDKDSGNKGDQNKDKGGNKSDNKGDNKQGKEGNKDKDSADKGSNKKPNEGHTVAGHKGGYRIQAMIVTGSKGKAQATARAREIASKYPNYRTYISYKAPSWRLRLGDFDNQDDAKSALAKMRRSFPSFSGEMSVVRDKINVWR